MVKIRREVDFEVAIRRTMGRTVLPSVDRPSPITNSYVDAVFESVVNGLRDQ
jgi:hypothetical protein